MTDPTGARPRPPSGPDTAPRPAGLASAPGSAGLESSIARVLTGGTYLSIVFLAVGVALMFGAGIGPLSGGPAFDPSRVVSDLTALRPAGFIWLGLVVVVATPAARVAASLMGYTRRGERTMSIVAGLILIVIAASVALAKGLEG